MNRRRRSCTSMPLASDDIVVPLVGIARTTVVVYDRDENEECSTISPEPDVEDLLQNVWFPMRKGTTRQHPMMI